MNAVNYEERKATYQVALETWGPEAQTMMAVTESTGKTRTHRGENGCQHTALNPNRPQKTGGERGRQKMRDGYCWLCGRWGHLEEHHIFGGAYRKKSTKYGLTVYLCGDRCHRNGPQAAHRCRETAQRLHEYGQRKFMREQNATIEDFRREFGKNYLPEETDE